MSKERYEVSQKDNWVDMVPIPTTHTVVITDKETGEEFKASSTTVERATERAWEKVGESQKK